eukprot:2403231-Pyramimonas_sp.AAC.1
MMSQPRRRKQRVISMRCRVMLGKAYVIDIYEMPRHAWEGIQILLLLNIFYLYEMPRHASRWWEENITDENIPDRGEIGRSY